MNKNKNSNTLQQKPHTEHHLTSVTSVEPSVHHQDEQQNQQPLITFGVLADIQYAPIPDGFSFGGRPRYYRHALKAATHAAKHFQEDKVSLVINLGDIVDGKCQEIEKWCKEEMEEKEWASEEQGNGVDKNEDEEPSNPGHDAVDDVIQALSEYKNGPIIHTYGNHELYNLSREEISNKLKIPFVVEPCGDLVGYYSYKNPQCPQLRFVVLDSYDIAIMQRCPETSIKHQKAVSILRKNNPNYPLQENSPEGLKGVQKRFVAFNGGVGEPQKMWLQNCLEKAKQSGEKVIIISHQPIKPKSSGEVCLIWNYTEILDILRLYKCTVAAAFAGHAHKGGYKRDEESGIHFRVFEAVLESEEPTKTYAFVDYYDGRLVVRGVGDCQSAVYKLDHLSPIT
jgi:manganese-dependent ADP-ribose/CDP-alcohol diphosphatase